MDQTAGEAISPGDGAIVRLKVGKGSRQGRLHLTDIRFGTSRRGSPSAGQIVPQVRTALSQTRSRG